MRLRAAIIGLLSANLLAPAAFASCDEPEPGRFAANGAEVYDSKTNLTWQRCSVGQSWSADKCTGQVQALTWDQARKAAHDTWRLPTREELLGLVETPCGLTQSAKSVFDVDPYHPSYWSSTAPDADLAWEVDLNNGSIFDGFRNAPNAVRLVRTGK